MCHNEIKLKEFLFLSNKDVVGERYQIFMAQKET